MLLTLITYSWHRSRRRGWPRAGAAGCQPYLPDRERGFTGIAHADLRAEEGSVVTRSIGVDPGNGTAEGAGIVRHSPAANADSGSLLEFNTRRR